MSSDSATTERADAVAVALRALGSAYRGDWSDEYVDGRTIEDQLWMLASALTSTDVEFDPASWIAEWGVCPECHHWNEYCECQEVTS